MWSNQIFNDHPLSPWNCTLHYRVGSICIFHIVLISFFSLSYLLMLLWVVSRPSSASKFLLLCLKQSPPLVHPDPFLHPWPVTYLVSHLANELGFPSSSDIKESACGAGDPGLIPVLGRYPGEGNGSTLQYFCLENSMHRGTWQAVVHGVVKSWTLLNDWQLLEKIVFQWLCKSRKYFFKKIPYFVLSLLFKIILSGMPSSKINTKLFCYFVSFNLGKLYSVN